MSSNHMSVMTFGSAVNVVEVRVPYFSTYQNCVVLSFLSHTSGGCVRCFCSLGAPESRLACVKDDTCGFLMTCLHGTMQFFEEQGGNADCLRWQLFRWVNE